MMKVAIIHDWLVTWGGAEKVLKAFLDLYPEADLFVIVDFLSEPHRSLISSHRIETSFIQNLPAAKRFYRHYLPLMPIAIEQFDLKGYDLVISSSHAVAKGIIPDPSQIHLCYCYSPMRYAWDMYHQYLDQAGLTRGLKSLVARYQLHRLRQWDVTTAARVDHFAACSEFIKYRIQRYYHRDADVIYPPVSLPDMSNIGCPQGLPDVTSGGFYLAASRQVSYKRIDLIIKAFNFLPEKKLWVLGDGPEHDYLKSIAGNNVTFISQCSDETMHYALSQSNAFIFMAEEDFGILPVEAQALGTPVIAYGVGGCAETVIPDVTGVWVKEQTVDSLLQAIESFEARQSGLSPFSPDDCRQNAARFSLDFFNDKIEAWVKRAWVNSDFKYNEDC